MRRDTNQSRSRDVEGQPDGGRSWSRCCEAFSRLDAAAARSIVLDGEISALQSSLGALSNQIASPDSELTVASVVFNEPAELSDLVGTLQRATAEAIDASWQLSVSAVVDAAVFECRQAGVGGAHAAARKELFHAIAARFLHHRSQEMVIADTAISIRFGKLSGQTPIEKERSLKHGCHQLVACRGCLGEPQFTLQ